MFNFTPYVCRRTYCSIQIMARMKVVEEVRQEQEMISGETGSGEMTQKMIREI